MAERRKKIKEKRESQENPKQLHPKEIRPEPGTFIESIRGACNMKQRSPERRGFFVSLFMVER